MSSHRLPLLLVLALYSIVFTSIAWHYHDGMRTHKADLGQISQAIWNSSHGRFVEMTDNGPVSTRLTDHVEPVLALISPILWLWRDVKALLLLQVLFAAAGGWLLYELTCSLVASKKVRGQNLKCQERNPLELATRTFALALVTGYLLSPQLQNGLLTEFHAGPLAVPFIFWAFLAVEKDKWGQFAIATLLTALVKEEMALLAAGLGMWGLWRIALRDLQIMAANGQIPNRNARMLLLDSETSSQASVSANMWGSSPHRNRLSRYWLTLAVIVGTSLWFYVATFVIVPAHALEVYETAENPYWARYGALGDSPLDIVRSLFTQPGTVWQIASEPVRVDYLWTLLSTFGLFSLLAPEILLLSLPLLLANLLSAYPPQYYGEFHYSAPLIPYFAVSSACGSARLWRWWRQRQNHNQNRYALWFPFFIAAWILFWAGSVYSESGRGPWGGRHDPPLVSDHHQLLDRFVTQIPPDAAVTATAAVHPHVALRRFVYQFPIGLPQLGEQGNAEWALLDVTTNTDLAPGDLRDMVIQMLAAEWGVVDAADGFLLLRYGEPSKEIPPAFYDFARGTKEVAPERATSVALSGMEIHDWPRWRSTRIVSSWLVGPDFDPARDRPQLAVRRPNGELVFDFATLTPPALLWYPPELWQPGEQIRITTQPLYLPKSWGVVIDARFTSTGGHQSSGKEFGAEIATYVRQQNNQLERLSGPFVTDSSISSAALVQNFRGVTSVTGQFEFAETDGTIVSQKMTAWLIEDKIWPGRPVNLLLAWSEGAKWAHHLSSFVHVRQGNRLVAQADGPPRWFLIDDTLPSPDSQVEQLDWRQLTIEAGTTDADEVEEAGENLLWNVFVGLYDPETGERATLVDENGTPLGTEYLVGQILRSAPPLPDFTCAMIPETCDSQPVID